MGDGHLNKCKECCKAQSDEREKRLRLDDIWREKERLRSLDKYYRLNYREIQHELRKTKPYCNKTNDIHRKLKTRGVIKENEIAHHWNYNLIDDVIIMDKKLHRRIHTKIVLNIEEKIFYTKQGEKLDTLEKHLDYIKSMLSDVEYYSIRFYKIEPMVKQKL
jgi:hypothetical protein